MVKVPVEKGNLTKRVAYNIYPHSQENEVRTQVTKAKTSKVATSNEIVRNVLPKKLPKVRV